MPSREEGMAFMNRLEGLIVPQGGGKEGIQADALRTLVSENPELTIAVVRAYLQMEPRQRGRYQLAVALAGVYEAEFGDDSLSRFVHRSLEEAGASDALPEFKTVGRVPAAPREPRGVVIEVDLQSLKRNDIYGFVKKFSIDMAETAELSKLAERRASCLLAFDIVDPREVWEIPEVRQYVARLSEVLPYFPYYLTPKPEAGAYFMYFACLADPDAVGEGPRLDLSHPSVLFALAHALAAMKGLCLKLGDDPRHVCDESLAFLPPHLREVLLAGVGLGDASGS